MWDGLRSVWWMSWPCGAFQVPQSGLLFKTWLSIFSSVSIPLLAAVCAPFWGLYLILNINKMASMYSTMWSRGAIKGVVPVMSALHRYLNRQNCREEPPWYGMYRSLYNDIFINPLHFQKLRPCLHIHTCVCKLCALSLNTYPRCYVCFVYKFI